MLKEITKALRDLNNNNLKEVNITDDSVFVSTRRGRTIEINVKGLSKKEAVKKVLSVFPKKKK